MHSMNGKMSACINKISCPKNISVMSKKDAKNNMRVIIKKDARKEILIHPESLLAFQERTFGC